MQADLALDVCRGPGLRGNFHFMRPDLQINFISCLCHHPRKSVPMPWRSEDWPSSFVPIPICTHPIPAPHIPPWQPCFSLWNSLCPCPSSSWNLLHPPESSTIPHGPTNTFVPAPQREPHSQPLPPPWALPVLPAPHLASTSAIFMGTSTDWPVLGVAHLPTHAHLSPTAQ